MDGTQGYFSTLSVPYTSGMIDREQLLVSHVVHLLSWPNREGAPLYTQLLLTTTTPHPHAWNHVIHHYCFAIFNKMRQYKHLCMFSTIGHRPNPNPLQNTVSSKFSFYRLHVHASTPNHDLLAAFKRINARIKSVFYISNLARARQAVNESSCQSGSR